MFFSASCGQTSRKAEESKEKTVQLHNHHPEISFSGSNTGLGDGAAIERTDVPMCSLTGFFHGEAGRLLAAHGGTRGAPGCVAERPWPWPPEGTSCRVTEVALCRFTAEGAKERGTLRPAFSCPQTSLSQHPELWPVVGSRRNSI